MSAMLGEMLLKVGALTEAQLEQVLSAQAVYGGRLGTNLVEMGLIAEDQLSRLLSEKLGVACIEAAALESIPPEVVSVVPLEMVQSYHVLPVALDGRRLTLAMADPSDFKAIDAIGFFTGLVIVPRICSELRLNVALEQYCGIKRPLRYIPVDGGLRSRHAEAAGYVDAAGHGDAAVHGDAGAAAYGFGQSGGHLEVLRDERHVTVKNLAEELAGASGEAEVISALLAYLGSEFDRGSILSLKCDAAVGVQAVCAGAAVEGFAGHVIALDGAELLRQVVQQRRLFVGELPAGGGDARLMEAMGGTAPAPAVLVPLSVGDHVAAVLCVNDLKGRLSGGVFELQRVAVMAELTFEMICIKKRIRTC